MKYQEQHEAFKKLLIQQGISRLSQLDQALPFGYSIPQFLVERWLNRILQLPKGFSSQRRYVNRFKVGADPEFVFLNEGYRADAQKQGLQQGLAFGVDNNGRLVEIRPWPSRSVLEVTASILTTLRWLAVLKPKTLLFDWVAGAFILGDGLGGHVHFGRKRPGRDLEVKALDAIDEELIAIKAYPAAEVQRRRQGDDHHQLYGLPGDIRPQRHGYEYRTFPSWLDSPELAFLTMTLSKLAVHNPKLAQGYAPLQRVENNIQRIKNFLAYYKDIDDDARLALNMLAKNFPTHIGGDFKKRWGIDASTAKQMPIQFIPASIQPSTLDIQEMFEYLKGSQPLVNRELAANWGPLNPPADYVMSINQTVTYGAKGLGELLWDVCSHKNNNYVVVNTRDLNKGAYFSIPDTLADILPVGWKKFYGRQFTVHAGDSGRIYSNEKSRCPDTFEECRRLLLETILPFWQISKVKPDSWLQWHGSLRKGAKPPEKYVGKVLYGEALTLKELR